jgi:hypothetical protein
VAVASAGAPAVAEALLLLRLLLLALFALLFALRLRCSRDSAARGDRGSPEVHLFRTWSTLRSRATFCLAPASHTH